MNIPQAVAHSIHHNLDIVGAMPDITELPVEKLEEVIEKYILDLQHTLTNAIQWYGESFLRDGKINEFARYLKDCGVDIPESQLREICRGIYMIKDVDCRGYIGTDNADVYYVCMAIDF